LIPLLVDIVAKGGNFLPNVGPQPDGTLPPVAVSRLEEIGCWMDVNADAIHGTLPAPPYNRCTVQVRRSAVDSPASRSAAPIGNAVKHFS